jgi:hypothetical protein
LWSRAWCVEGWFGCGEGWWGVRSKRVSAGMCWLGWVGWVVAWILCLEWCNPVVMGWGAGERGFSFPAGWGQDPIRAGVVFSVGHWTTG